MELEGVGVVSMGNVGLKIGGQVENLDGFEWAPETSVRHQSGWGRKRPTSSHRYHIQYIALLTRRPFYPLGSPRYKVFPS